ncbi:thioredoxin family protein [Owenweeksia hongkongensis]|uniref:thioredoxin family protein n=1 Tax=Owenweeksia hongkongensis TaxID=253245 RepID=UPI003A940F28
MKKLSYLLAIAATAVFAFAFTNNDMLSIGEKAPLADVKMKDVSGKSLSLNDMKGENGLLVIFSCNTCPFVIGWEDQYPGLGKFTKKNNVGMVLVNSNEAKRAGEDSMEEMKAHYKDAGYNTPYVIDENHKLADAMGGKTTPHVYLFDKDMKLVYRGAINDKYENKEKKATKFYLNDAIAQLVKGQEIDNPVTTERGCSIKRVKS